ncbi:isopentenyl phosphate kinase [Methanolobus bombayensis]|uniref:isopentenyl phosphate kinase n=1 Tax=Methanolobus bombayensis TaxID=38023 RepID=UPI001AE92159|nr:isopentenyl phosphate kinase [Methanolobus bombayensis]MBP1910191.1 isopentenyl phosphate kinase [Methanolobus bombayensis]
MDNSNITILKIGGSVITDKSADDGAARTDQIERIAREIAGFEGKLIIVHGAGSFGHPQVKRFGLTGKFDHEGSIITHMSVRKLNTIVVEALNSVGVNALPVHPMACAVSSNSRIKSMFLEQIEEMLESGFVPVLHGDMVMDTELGTSVLSGDQIVPYLAIQMKASRIGIGSAEEGVLDDKKEVIPLISNGNFEEIKAYLGGSTNTDVTGGMLGKVLELLELSEQSNSTSYIFNAGNTGNICDFLNGKNIGTAISGTRTI